jgi:hypothetical protein
MLLITLGLMLTRPIIIGPAPHRPAKRLEALAYSERALGFTVLLILAISGAGYGSIMLVRRANEEYRRLAMENMQSLIEGAIEDHKQKAEDQHEHVE